MARFIKSDVVVRSFPFSDLLQSKKRPALFITKFLDRNYRVKSGKYDQKTILG